jgi:hypothetical protein
MKQPVPKNTSAHSYVRTNIKTSDIVFISKNFSVLEALMCIIHLPNVSHGQMQLHLYHYWKPFIVIALT